MTSSRTGQTAIRRPGAGIIIDRDRLVRLRQAKLLSRAQLASAMSDGDYSITPDAIAKIENGHRRPKTATLARMCDVLDCKAADLLPAPPKAKKASARKQEPGQEEPGQEADEQEADEQEADEQEADEQEADEQEADEQEADEPDNDLEAVAVPELRNGQS